MAGDRILVRDVGRGIAADLIGAAALVWVAIESGASAPELVAELGVGRPMVDETIASLLAAGWAELVSR